MLPCEYERNILVLRVLATARDETERESLYTSCCRKRSRQRRYDSMERNRGVAKPSYVVCLVVDSPAFLGTPRGRQWREGKKRTYIYSEFLQFLYLGQINLLKISQII